MNVATIGKNYAYRRMINDANIAGINYFNYTNWYNPFIKKLFHTYEIYPTLFHRKIDAYHTFNTIMLTKKPWCCTFETMLPRGRQLLTYNHHQSFDVRPGWYMKKLLEVCMKDNCKRLIAYTKCNYDLQLKVYDLFPDIREELSKKTIYLSCPQKIYVDTPQTKVPNVVKFFFMGKDFIRKGMPETIRALYELRKSRNDFEIHIITDKSHVDNYAFNDFQDTKKEIEEVYHMMDTSKDWCHFYKPMSYSACIELMKNCHVGLLPTWADTLGFSSLDMQGAGLPILTTNVRAQTEENRDGWILKLPVNYCGEVGLRSRDEKMKVRKIFINELFNVFNEILDNKQDIIRRSSLSLDNIRQNHSYKKYSEEISHIYSEF